MLPIAVTKELLMLKGQQFTIIYKRSLGWLLKGSECQAARQPSTKLWVEWICYHAQWCPQDVVDELWLHAEDSWNQPMADFLPWFLVVSFDADFRRQRNGLRWIWLYNKSEEKAARLVMLVDDRSSLCKCGCLEAIPFEVDSFRKFLPQWHFAPIFDA